MQQGNAAEPLPTVDEMIERLRQRLESEPDNVDGWRMLGWSEMAMNRPDAAVSAYRRAVKLSPGTADLHSALAEALISAAGETVTVEAAREIESALGADADNPRGLYYMGLARLQAGDRNAADAIWRRLKTNTALDNRLRETLALRLEALQGSEYGEVDLFGVPPPAGPL